PLTFYFNFIIFSDTQARPIHLAYGLLLAYAAFPGVIARHRLPPVFAVLWLVTGVGLGLYGAQLALAGSDQWPVFAVMSALSLVVAYMAYRPHRLDRVPIIDWALGIIGALTTLY